MGRHRFKSKGIRRACMSHHAHMYYLAPTQSVPILSAQPQEKRADCDSVGSQYAPMSCVWTDRIFTLCVGGLGVRNYPSSKYPA